MAKSTITSSDGLTTRCSAFPTYRGQYLKPAYIEFRQIASPSPIAFEVGDICVYSRMGQTFKLYDVPVPKKQARRDSYGAAFVYENVQLYAATKDLELTPFFDFVYRDNTLHFSSRKETSTYEDVAGIARRLQACMDELHPGEWSFVVASGTLPVDITEAKEVSISGSVLDALNSIYDTWEGIGWAHSIGTGGVNVITIGGPNIRTDDNTTDLFRYGKGKGLKVISGSVTNKDEIMTRMFPFGSERNMPNDYYRTSMIYQGLAVDIPNLMLPKSSWGTSGDPARPDPRKAYIDSVPGIAKYGIIPKRFYFDGTDGDEIYPTIQGVTIGEVRTGNPPITPSQDWSDTDRVDEVFAVTNPMDSGYIKSGDDKYEETKAVAPSTDSASITFNYEPDDYQGSVLIYHAEFFNVQTQAVNLRGVADVINSGRLAFFTSVNAVKLTFRIFSCAYNGQGGKNSIRTIYAYPVGQALGIYSYSVAMSDLFSAEGYVDNVYVYLVSVVDATGTYPGTSSMTFYISSTNATIGWYRTFNETFVMRIPQVGFDLNQQASLGSGIAISMKDGKCAGREFKVSRCQYVSSDDTWELTLVRSVDESTQYYYPNAAGYEIAVGDHFVILDIAMPNLYINIASNRLLAAATAKLAELVVESYQYTPEIDPIVMAEQERQIREGMWFQMEDIDFPELGEGDVDLFSSDDKDLHDTNDVDLLAPGGTGYILIDSVTISEGEASIPKYSVTLRDKKAQTLALAIGTMQSKIETVAVAAKDAHIAATNIGKRVVSSGGEGGNVAWAAEAKGVAKLDVDNDVRDVQIAGNTYSPRKRYALRLEAKGKESGGQGVKDHRVNSIKVIVENYDAALLDSNEYKFFLLRWRKRGWRAATLSNSNINAIKDAGLDSWAITGNKTVWMNGESFYDLPLATYMPRTSSKYKFKNTHTSTQKIGCAIYRNTGEGTFGWQRVSNIAYIELSTKTNGSWRFRVRQE